MSNFLPKELVLEITSYLNDINDISKIDDIFRFTQRDYIWLFLNRYPHFNGCKPKIYIDYKCLYTTALREFDFFGIDMLNPKFNIRDEYYPNNYLVLYLVSIDIINPFNISAYFYKHQYFTYRSADENLENNIAYFVTPYIKKYFDIK